MYCDFLNIYFYYLSFVIIMNSQVWKIDFHYAFFKDTIILNKKYIFISIFLKFYNIYLFN